MTRCFKVKQASKGTTGTPNLRDFIFLNCSKGFSKTNANTKGLHPDFDKLSIREPK